MYVYNVLQQRQTHFTFYNFLKEWTFIFLFSFKQDFKLVNIMFLSRQSHKFRSGRRIHSLTKCLAGPGFAADEMIFWRDNLLIRRLSPAQYTHTYNPTHICACVCAYTNSQTRIQILTHTLSLCHTYKHTQSQEHTLKICYKLQWIQTWFLKIRLFDRIWFFKVNII